MTKKAQIKKKINILIDDGKYYGKDRTGGFSMEMRRVMYNVITEDLVAFVFETTQNETHYLYMKPVEKYDEYDISNFVSYLRKHCRLAQELNNGVI
jgi:hypothetical protein